ncbi:IF-2B-domain-containing protein [Polychaeton citri CBS 116435]|uniref:Translation initiation factor eIF2B subunit delta n=1 Tax=Polychaeton citri CBS 116435 TaxID=1314669 RepID=A0A9P4QF20_9PEZI|nr:IF-2B-domain-containing protein [Polychaeton citri CBS 116435]
MPDANKDQSPKEQPKDGDSSLSPAELKKRAKAEKQARRAAEKEQRGAGGAGGAEASSSATPQANGGPREVKQGQGQKQHQKGGQPPQQQQQQQQQQQPYHRRSGSQGAQQMPVREKPGKAVAGAGKQGKKEGSKQVELFSHLYTHPRRTTFEGVSKDVHPSVLAFGFKMASYEICGSSARCVAMLLAFKDAIQAYTTPTGTSLARHMTSHHLSPQIEFLKTCRAISESMGNAIRWLKKLIVEIDPNTAEQEAKDYLCEHIGRFIQERIMITDTAIAESAAQQIKPGSVVLTFAKSSIVEKTILEAHEAGTPFRVMVVDSRPLFEGKRLATSLMRVGLEVEYVPFSGLAHAVKDATVVLLGAHAMLSNGRLQSRIGTASVALQAHRAAIPVIVCCESVKFSEKVALDSIVLNEVAPSEELLTPSSLATAHAKKEGEDDEGDKASKNAKTLADWRDISNLQILNLMYDVTPAEYISMIVCEYGSLPPSSVPVVHRLANEGGIAA